MPTSVCVDASVVVKWYFVEASRPDALRLKTAREKGQLKLIAPETIGAEFVSSCLHKIRQGLADPDQVARIVDEFAASGVPVAIAVLPLRHEVLGLARGIGLSAWDATYVAVAQHYGVELWTADKELASRARRHGLSWVRELGRDPMTL